jgi:uncharacterized Zn finger protein
MASQTRRLTSLTVNNIHNWVGELQFNRGMQYVSEGLIIPRSSRRSVVRGWCLPKAGQPGSYYVWARLRGMRIGDAHCTCPLGKHGICPHVAAVLVRYLNHPETFQRSIFQQMMSWFSGRPALLNQSKIRTEQLEVNSRQVA